MYIVYFAGVHTCIWWSRCSVVAVVDAQLTIHWQARRGSRLSAQGRVSISCGWFSDDTPPCILYGVRPVDGWKLLSLLTVACRLASDLQLIVTWSTYVYDRKDGMHFNVWDLQVGGKTLVGPSDAAKRADRHYSL